MKPFALATTVAALVAAFSAQAAPAAPTPIRIQKCLAAKSGLPCYPFRNRARVVKRIRANLLYYEGFRPAMTFTYTNPRKILLRGIQDGDRMEGTVVKSGRRQVWVSLSTVCIRDAYGQYATSGGPAGLTRTRSICPSWPSKKLSAWPSQAQLGVRAEPEYAGRMFNVSRTVLMVIAVLAIVLLVLGLATDLGLFGWVLALILGAYVVAALVMSRRAAA